MESLIWGMVWLAVCVGVPTIFKFIKIIISSYKESTTKKINELLHVNKRKNGKAGHDHK